MFKEEHPEVKFGRSTFAKLKPLHVLHRHKIPKDACLCMYHKNVILLCEALHKVLPNSPAFSGDFVGNLVCSTSSELCTMGKFQVCKDKVEQSFGSFEGTDFSIEIFCYEWSGGGECNQTVHSRKKEKKETCDFSQSKNKRRIEKKLRAGTVAEAIKQLLEKMPNGNS